MALVDCSECGERVSSSVSTCPKCEHPIHPDRVGVGGLTDTHSGVMATPGDLATTSAERSREGSRSRLPTGLLFVLAFVIGSTVLIAGVYAAAIVIGSILDELDALTADDDAPVVVETTVPVVGEDGLVVGQCIDDDELDKYLAGDDFSLVPCDDPHDAEIYFVHDFPSGPYPGDETVVADLKSVCRAAFEEYVGRDFESSALNFWSLWPTEGWWESGNRVGECALFGPDSSKLTGSAYQSGW